MTIEIGQPAPPFTLNDADGQPVALETFRGRPVVVYFYPKDDTPGCAKEACGFRDLWDEITATGAVVLGISRDDAASHQKFRGKYNLPFTLLTDPDGTVMEQYGAWGEKTAYGKKTVGAIRSTVLVDPDGMVKKHWKQVKDAEAHPAQVLEALKGA